MSLIIMLLYLLIIGAITLANLLFWLSFMAQQQELKLLREIARAKE